MRYKAITSATDADGRLNFNGKTCGIQFSKGVAIFDDVTIDKELGLTAAEVADQMEKDFGYKVEKMNDDGTPFIETTKTASTKGKPQA